MSGWYMVYLMVCGFNGILLALEGYFVFDWQWWVFASIPIICYIAGREVEGGK